MKMNQRRLVSENSYKDLDDINENESREYQVPVGIYMIKVNKRNTRTDVILVSLLLTLNIFHTLF